ncbi:MAG: DUF4129 domain-containing protein [Saprospiraceae bacterium]|nr:DUF4129 domain-containing protein [Saprospiraceae bacterium]
MREKGYISTPKAQLIRQILLLVLVCTLNFVRAPGQGSPAPNSYLQEEKSTNLLSDKEWEDWSKKRDNSKYWKDIQEAKREAKKEEDKPDKGLNTNLIKALATFLLIVIGIIVAFFVVRQLMGLQLRPRNRKIKRQGDLTINLEEIEDKLEEVVLEDFIQEAIRNENFALAIRLYYLEALKTLSQQKQISWKKDKTNRDYLFEMRNSEFYLPFQKITRLFERVWYGNRSIDAAIFYDIAPTYQKFIADVSAQNLTTTP